MKKDPLIFIEDILKSVKNIESFSKGLTKEKFIKNRLRQSAIIRELEIIGEAVKNVPEEFKNKYHKIEWKKIAGLRDKLIHTYFEIDLDLVWEIVNGDLLKLKKEIEIILSSQQK
ncbi:MAG: DUF86 domain-containing protein [Nanoarchaeota archaeon]|nr:DUF86 domain-containing protein [Nanoarchaeota archaeon]MBU1876525.1 DUF86 domain-containing protein [Nanoarchaeota archaeon]